MKILAIDTSSKFLCLGIYDSGRIYEYNIEVGTRLSSLLSVTIKRVLDNLGWDIGEIDYFACGVGPGSFTGMRVGISAIKGLSWSTGKPVIAIPSLDLLAQGIEDTQKQIIPIVDAKRSLIYCSVYKKQDGEIKRIKPYMLLNEKELLKNIKDNAILVGDASSLYKERIQASAKGLKFLEKDHWYPKGRHILTLALQRIKDKKTGNSFNIKPIYLYPKECQIKK